MKRNKKLYCILLVILILLTITNVAYSTKLQDTIISISIFEFKNKSNSIDYNYLSSVIQKSIYASIENMIKVSDKEIQLVPTKIVNEYSKKYNLSIDSLDNIPNILRYSLETQTNIMILGEFFIDNESNKMSIHVPIYSVAKRSFIAEKTYETDLTKDIYEFVDGVSVDTTSMVKEKKNEILIGLEELKRQAYPPKYEKQPTVTDVDSNVIKIEWLTNKETVSELFLLSEKTFNKNKIIKKYNDESKDAINHIAYVPMKDISDGKDYYFIAQDTDLLGQQSVSESLYVNYKNITAIAEKALYERIAYHYKESEKYANINIFNEALKELNKILVNVIPQYKEFLQINEEEIIAEVKSHMRTLLDREVEWRINNARKYANDTLFNEAFGELDKILSDTVPRYEPFIDIDKDSLKKRIEEEKKALKRTEIESVNKTGLDYYPWYMRFSILAVDLNVLSMSNVHGGPPVDAFLGIEVGFKVSKIGIYPFLKLIYPYIINFFYMEGSVYNSYELGLVALKGVFIFDLGARYFSKPARITYNVGLSLENVFTFNPDHSYGLSIKIDGGLSLHIPLGFYFNLYANIFVFPTFNLTFGLDGGFSLFLGAETPKTDVVFDASLYPFRLSFSFTGSFINLFTYAKGGLNLVADFGFMATKNLYVFFELGYFPALGNIGGSIEGQPYTSYDNGIYIGSGVEWLINPSNIMFSLFIEPVLQIAWGNKIEKIGDDTVTTPITGFFLTIDPGFCIQFLFPFGAYFKMSFPISIIKDDPTKDPVSVPGIDIGIKFGFGIRWYFS